ncbi:MAG: DUF1648 domain-containing protein [Planctomycetes bacterium]|nr:DUF1648 domain-containing protein [Planctomycetota bacterium]
MSRNVIQLLNLLIIIGLFVFSFIVYPDLPDKIPSHINYEGKADSFADKTHVIWLLIPILSLIIFVLICLISHLMDKKPGWINMPHKQKYLELSENMRNNVNQYLKTFMLILCFMMTVILFEVQLMLYQAAMSVDKQADTLNTYLVMFFAVIFIIYIIVYLFKFSTLIKTAWASENEST